MRDKFYTVVAFAVCAGVAWGLITRLFGLTSHMPEWWLITAPLALTFSVLLASWITRQDEFR